eukprot:scaffold152121_cov29-Prasinocladus_malaysianus.AAC.1
MAGGGLHPTYGAELLVTDAHAVAGYLGQQGCHLPHRWQLAACLSRTTLRSSQLHEGSPNSGEANSRSTPNCIRMQFIFCYQFIQKLVMYDKYTTEIIHR